MTVSAVIVTYNRFQLLRETVNAVLSQSRPPENIIIIDNHSHDETVPWLNKLESQHKHIHVVYMNKNLGGAGGFHYGLKMAYEMGSDWIWTLDDDCLPKKDALEQLTHFKDNQGQTICRQIGFLASNVRWTDGSPHQMNIPGPVTSAATGHDSHFSAQKIRYASFVSILINRHAIRRVGYPVKEFFIYCDDVEFTRRITRAGFNAWFVPESIVCHQTALNVGLTMDRILRYPPIVHMPEYVIRNLIAVNRDEPYGTCREPGRLLFIWVRLLLNHAPISYQISMVRAGIKGLFINYRRWIQRP